MSQDPTEENFGHHRAAGRRNEHPSLYQFGYDSNMIRMSISVVSVTGNSKGGNRMTTNIRHKIFPRICSSLPKCKSSFLAYYSASFSRFPRILCMHLFYFDTSLNINKPPGYNNTYPWLRTNYIERKKCHKSNDFTDI